MHCVALHALLSHWRRHWGQFAALTLGLALATGLWSGVQAINAEARASYERAAAAVGQDRLDRLAHADGRAVPMADFLALRRAGWLVSPVIEGRLPEADLRLIGIDPLTAPGETGAPDLSGDDAVAFLTAPGLLLVSDQTAARPRFRAAEADLPPRRIAPDIPTGTALADIGTAARLLRQDGFSYLLLASEQPRSLPPLASVTSLERIAAGGADDLARLTDSFHLNLTAFGLLAFAVGLFIVHAAIGLAFEQRRPTFRTLRALGLPLRSLIALLAAETVLIAVVAGLLGVALGYLVASVLLPGVSVTLRGLYGAEVGDGLSFDPLWAASALGIAVAGAGIAAAQALWRVARMPLLASAQPRAWALASARALGLQSALAAGLLALAAALAVFGNSLLLGFACLAALLIGAALALPGLFTVLLSALGRTARHPLGEWLFADTRQQLPGLSLALMALMLALATNIGVSTMVGSFRTTFTGWLDQRLAAELYVTARSEGEAAEIRAFLGPRVGAVLPISSVESRIAGLPATVYGVRDHATYRDHWPLLAAGADVWDRVAAGTGALINEQLSRREGLGPGDTVTLGPGWHLPVVGVYSDYGNPAAQAMVGFETLAARFPDLPLRRMAVRVDPGEAAALASDLVAQFDLPPSGVVDQAEVKRLSMRVFEQTFLVTGALNLLTLGVAGLALLTSLLTLSGMRLPQLAPVWAMGLTRAQLAGAELGRAVCLAALTWLVSIPVGLLLAWVLLAVVNVEAFGWRLPMQVFPTDWLRLGLWALAATGLAAAFPAVRLARMPPADLLRVFANER